MYKVMIADDESKVIQLIKTLIDWDSMDIELVGIANDGISALAMIEEKKPDIVITDIRMPGYDGIELIKRAKSILPEIDFVIISGYQHFDYAHNAIKYDVKDYLLKPLKKEEINSTLLKMISGYDKERTRSIETDQMIKRLKKDQVIIQSEFIQRLMDNFEIMIDDLTLETLNEAYQFNFMRQYFRMLTIKPDFPFHVGDEELLQLLMEKTAAIATSKLRNNLSDMMLHKGKDQIYVLINYDSEDRKNIRASLLSIIDEVTALRDLFQSVYVSIALSDEVSDIKGLKSAKGQVDRRIMDKVLSSTNRVIESDHVKQMDLKIYLDQQQTQNFIQLIRELNIEAFSKHFKEWMLTLSLSKDISGEGYLSLCQDIIDLTIDTLSKFDLLDASSDNMGFSKLEQRMERTVTGLFDYCLKYLVNVLEQSLALRKQRNRSPVEEAIQYIEEHYWQAVGLDQISEIVGFNASYFSTLFKKETGKNFLEYLTGLRMTHAKDFLSDQKLSVAEVAEKCGYMDVKHFSKQFKKHTGLTPAKYRKLYY